MERRGAHPRLPPLQLDRDGGHRVGAGVGALTGRWICRRCYTSSPDDALTCASCGEARPTAGEVTAETRPESPEPPETPESPESPETPEPPELPGEVAAPVSAAMSIHWSELQVGDCFNADDAGSIDLVTPTPCDQPHVHEVFYVESLPGNLYPTEDDMDAELDRRCTPAFEAYVGHDYATSDWLVSYLSPEPEAWAYGERTMVCHLANATETAVSGSARGSAR